ARLSARRGRRGVMSQAERVEALVLGSGVGGKHLAWHLGAKGQRTALVERRWIGGSLHNVNCMPSKNQIKNAEGANTVHHAAAYGTIVTGARTDMTKVLARKRKMVEESIAAHIERFRATGVELILGEARFVAPKTMEVTLNGGGTRVLTGERVFL